MAERRACAIRLAGEQRVIAAEDAGRYRDALGAMPPSGLPEAFLEPVPDALRGLVARCARAHGPFHTTRSPSATRLEPAGRRRRPRGPRDRRHAGARRAPARRLGARVVRRRGRAPPAPGQPGRPAEARSSPPTPGPSGASFPTGSGSTGRAPPAASTPSGTSSRRSRGSPCRPPSGRARCSPGGWPTTARPASTSSPPGERSCGWARVRAGSAADGWPSTSVRTPPCSGRRRATRRPKARWRTRCAPPWREAPASGTTCAPPSRSLGRTSSRPSGRWSGPARSPTTSGCRCARLAACRRRGGPAPARAGGARAAPGGERPRPWRGAGRWPSRSSATGPPPASGAALWRSSSWSATAC